MSDEQFHFDDGAPSAGLDWLDRPLAWCRNRRRILLLLCGAFQLALLAAMTAIHAAPLIVGETILLKVEPIDPRDLFRGDYVTLSYVINRVPEDGIIGIANSRDQSGRYYTRKEPEERTVYVALEKDKEGNFWHGTWASVHRPTSGKYIRGVYRKLSYGDGRIYFGIEAFYVPEGTGRKYEDAARRRQLMAEIAVAPWGQAKLRGLRIE
jgi:uncharacterized membrane-anchored protein